jgi:hypothetical protein
MPSTLKAALPRINFDFLALRNGSAQVLSARACAFLFLGDGAITKIFG